MLCKLFLKKDLKWLGKCGIIISIKILGGIKMNSRSYWQWKRENRKRKRIKKKKTFLIIWLAVMLLIGILIGGTVVFFAVHQKATDRKQELLSGVVRFCIEIHEEEYEELVAEHSIDNPSSPEDRNVNLKVGAEIINGTRVEPGEKCSWLEIVGNPTLERGFKEAGELSEGKKTVGIGGGICQVSSTIYSSLRKTDQNTDSEYLHAEGHSGKVSYLDASKGDFEASVAFSSSKDFWFINSQKYPIRLGVRAEESKVTAQIIAIRKKFSIVIKQVSKRGLE